ncbi:MAG: uracil phosphoribosyltransferase [Oscillospiraceae bacterium]|nr:uracil phosphoribosyltransferase [Oscillospiraceae bacterium]
MGKTVILDHPFITHKISVMRDENTGTKDFRTLTEEVAMLMTYEALRDLPTVKRHIRTPVAEADVPFIDGRKPAVVPILRAGLGMMTGILSLLPAAKVGHIGLSRDEKTHEPCEYYINLPGHLDDRLVIVPDPMLATGGSAIQAVDLIKSRGAKRIKYMCIIAVPEGLKALEKAHPDIDIYVGALDDHLNDKAYIVPGLGDAGDRIFGTDQE